MAENNRLDREPSLEHSSFESTFKQALSPFEEFLHQESSSGIVLMICVAVALVIANSPLYPLYESVLHTKISIGSPEFYFSHSLHHWINDGLMALFFFVIGLEVKREILIGELSDFRQALLPIGAALGGMIVPASFYLLFNQSGPAVDGWGIPMATDIAFAIGIVALLGSRIPKPLVAMLLALAIVDDIGAVLVIAVFYTETINITALIMAGIFLLLLIAANLAGVRQPMPYAILGLLLWLAMMKSGVHATLAGVLAAFTVPASSSSDSATFSTCITSLISEFKEQATVSRNISRFSVLRNSKKQAILQSIENGVHKMASPLQRMEHGLHIWVSFLIVPIFALANAGIPIDFKNLGSLLLEPVTIGIMVGLFFGKAIGIFLSSWLILRLSLSVLPEGVTLSQILGIAFLAGIGFTMSIFIGTLAFAQQPELLHQAKIGIVFGSLVSGITGYIWLYKSTGK
jgi:NhaA family Na+:H+ antiporter